RRPGRRSRRGPRSRPAPRRSSSPAPGRRCRRARAAQGTRISPYPKDTARAAACTRIGSLSCPGENSLLDYIEGRLPAAARATLAGHAAGCPRCRELVDRAEVREPATLPPADRSRYEIHGEVAQGGIGRILRARDRHLGRWVALKVPKDPADRARFAREALVTARLQHPAIVPLYEAGLADDGTPFYAMKLVEGRTLKDLLDERRRPKERLALLPNVLAAAEAVAYAHGQGVIHRDLKPANLLVGELGETVVIDWGLGKDLAARGRADAADGETV